MARTLAALLLILAGCGDGGAETTTPSPTPQATVTPDATEVEETTAPTDEECSDETIKGDVQVTVEENDNAFSPSCIVMLGGQSLEILNKGSSLHNFSILESPINLDTQAGEATRTEAISGALEPGTYRFFCKFHQSLGMEGELTVTEAG